MRRRTKQAIVTLTNALYDILSTGYLVTLVGLLSQGRTGPKLFKGLAGYSHWRIKQALKEQKLKGYIEYDDEDERAPIFLTAKGFVRQSKQKIKAANFGKWDHLWRLILFDIPERKRLRKKFQRFLQNVGCYRVQKSVYAFPYDCKKEFFTIASSFKVGSNVDIYAVPNLGRHEQLARNFYFRRDLH